MKVPLSRQLLVRLQEIARNRVRNFRLRTEPDYSITSAWAAPTLD